MTIKDIRVKHLRIPLNIAFKQANNVAPSSSSIVLEILTQNGHVGYGECCPRSYVTGECPDQVLSEIRNLIPSLRGLTIMSVEALKNLILQQLGKKLQPAALCAFDLALLDAFAKENSTSILGLLNGKAPKSLTYTGVIPMGKEAQIRPILEAFSFRSIKIKVGNDFEVSKQRIKFIQSIYGRDIPIRIDANTSWTYLDAVQQIPEYIKLGVTSFEQPFMPTHNKDMGFLNRYFGAEASIMADESLTDLSSAFELISRGYCNHFNLKISKHGGILRTLKIYKIAQIAGISCQLGAHFGETSILARAGMVVAAKAPSLTHLEGAFGTHVLKEDIWTQSIKFDRAGQISNPEEYLLSNKHNRYAKAS